MSTTIPSRDRLRGALVGLAVGDALGAAVEFRPPGSFPPVTTITGGGPWGLQPGQWTDDTSMALCLAESLVTRGGFDARDQMERYVRWRHDGHLSSTGRCFDIGLTTRASLDRFVATGEPFAGPEHAHTAGNGSAMRLAPVAIFFAHDPRRAVAACAESSRTTHAAPVAVDVCRYLGAILTGGFAGARKDELLAASFEPAPKIWTEWPLHPVVAEIASGSFRRKEPPAIKGSGYAADCLEAALWAFHSTSTFRDGALAAVNLGDDADTTGAVYGQIAGAYYGESAIPQEWRAVLALWPVIDRLAEALATAGDRGA